jgi:hypothetical protein
MAIPETILRNLFNTSLYLEVVQLERRKSERIAEQSKIFYGENELSPQSQNLLSLFSPETQLRLARDFYLDDRKNAALIDKVDDPDYILFNPSANGLYLELWVCANIPCPICGHILYKYANPNMPVVDVVCINNHNNNGVNYFQIKATQSDSTDIYGFKYFSFDNNYVCVGSKRFGYNCHVIKANDKTNKDLLIGYICIEYNMTDDYKNTIKLDVQKSFLLLPNTQFIPTEEQNNWTFYSYTYNPNKAILTFNPIMVRKISFSDFYRTAPTINNIITDIISLNIDYDVIKVYNEPPDAPNFAAAAPAAQSAADAAAQQKYLIMKMKYLNLKKQIN